MTKAEVWKIYLTYGENEYIEYEGQISCEVCGARIPLIFNKSANIYGTPTKEKRVKVDPITLK